MHRKLREIDELIVNVNQAAAKNPPRKGMTLCSKEPHRFQNTSRKRMKKMKNASMKNASMKKSSMKKGYRNKEKLLRRFQNQDINIEEERNQQDSNFKKKDEL
jgi:hypothetical protein